MVVIAILAIVAVSNCEGEDKTANYQPVDWQTLDPQSVTEQWPTDASGSFPKPRTLA